MPVLPECLSHHFVLRYAVIGYFCVEAGVSLCISQPMMGLAGWLNLFTKEALILATPGIVAGALLLWIARTVESDVALPLAMVCIPAGFYLLLFVLGSNLEEASEHGWVGEAAPPVPVTDLFGLIDFRKVHWGLVTECLSTWLGMVCTCNLFCVECHLDLFRSLS